MVGSATHNRATREKPGFWGDPAFPGKTRVRDGPRKNPGSSNPGKPRVLGETREKPGFSKTRDFPSHGGPGFTQASAPPGDPVPPVDPAPARVCSLPIRLNEAKAAAGAGKQAQHGEAGRRCNMTCGAFAVARVAAVDKCMNKWQSVRSLGSVRSTTGIACGVRVRG